MEKRPLTTVSVRNLVEFVMRSGDIDGGFVSSSRAVEGTRGHQKVQEAGGENYTPEVSISYIYKGMDIDLEITGRIDGVIRDNAKTTIDEIKTTSRDLSHIDEDYNLRHWAQAMCYAYIYALQNRHEVIWIRLTYYNIDSGKSISFEREMETLTLEEFFNDMVIKYLRWTEGVLNWQEVRNFSIREKGFPFEAYRKGQRELAVAVYKTISKGRRLFSQAPTGTGKTMGVLFPAIKALGEGLTSRIFYLTAKTITRTVAENTLEIMRRRGLHIRSITLTAKEKICFNNVTSCNPVECEYARGHFDRINDALEDMLHEEAITRDVVEKYARRHRVCPFEFSLDAALFSDIVICDYNYLFDPRASLKRFFSEGSTDYVFLVDEAHNLVDRARDMFSAELQKGSFMDMKKTFKPIAKGLYDIFNEVNKHFIELGREVSGKEYIKLEEKPRELYKLIRRFTDIAEEELSRNPRGEEWEKLTDLYFEGIAFLRIFELFDNNYITYIKGSGRDLTLKLLCLDPSRILREVMDIGVSTILFSATLTPMGYYADMLGGCEEDYRVKLPSPFPEENLFVLMDNRLSTKFVDREDSYEEVAHDISSSLVRKGNYLVFFPSYKYMKEVYDIFVEINSEVDTVLQSSDMDEVERENFLACFGINRNKTLVGFAVMGGIFGEGIDLAGDRLIGAIIVGVGLPQVSPERNIIREHFEKNRGNGFEYAYIYPGINRVMQAAGRVIRTEKDTGIVLLIDSRFSKYPYRDLLPSEWKPLKRIVKTEDIEVLINDFWNKV